MIAQYDVASDVYQGMGIQVGYFFRGHGRMLMQRRDLWNVPVAQCRRVVVDWPVSYCCFIQEAEY